MWDRSPASIPGQPTARIATAMPMMNMRPPMVGVPALVACHLGPTSRISWPAFSRRRAGKITFQPSSPVTAKLSTHAMIISMTVTLPLS